VPLSRSRLDIIAPNYKSVGYNQHAKIDYLPGSENQYQNEGEIPKMKIEMHFAGHWYFISLIFVFLQSQHPIFKTKAAFAPYYVILSELCLKQS